MALPEKELFTYEEAGAHLALSRSSIVRLINEGQLTRVHPRPRSARITRESLVAHLDKARTPGAVAASISAEAQARAGQQQAAAETAAQKKKGGLLSRWGLNG